MIKDKTKHHPDGKTKPVFLRKASRFFRLFQLRAPFWIIVAGLAVLLLRITGNAYRGAGNVEFINLVFVFLVAVIAIIFVFSLIVFLVYLLSTRTLIREKDAIFIRLPSRVSGDGDITVYTALPSKRHAGLIHIRVAFCLNDEIYTSPAPIFQCRKGDLDMGDYDTKLPAGFLGGKTVIRGLPAGRYRITKSLIFFEDFLGMVRFFYEEKEENLTFFVLKEPVLHGKRIPEPQKDVIEKETKVKLKVPGEFLEFKKYNPASDSPRFILWKIYARTGELMVRKPEMENPNSSRIPVFVNFHCEVDNMSSREALDGLLSEYKSSVSGIVEELRRARFVLDYYPEECLDANSKSDNVSKRKYESEFGLVDNDRQIQAKISAHRWQNSIPLPKQIDMLKNAISAKGGLGSVVIFTSSLDTKWLDIFKSIPRDVRLLIFYKRFSSNFFAYKPFDNPLYSLFFFERNSKPWRMNTVSSRLKYRALYSRIVKNETYIKKKADKKRSVIVEV